MSARTRILGTHLPQRDERMPERANTRHELASAAKWPLTGIAEQPFARTREGKVLRHIRACAQIVADTRHEATI
ncbi:hypothetical protein GCM10022381_24060 [Leifsonia kafniensis]|uniref:Uncharacterized protein n=1 Tax=Leifsonia kafniensis TaxID=475957 RepID=A0ABP7KKM2_9MICO